MSYKYTCSDFYNTKIDWDLQALKDLVEFKVFSTDQELPAAMGLWEFLVCSTKKDLQAPQGLVGFVQLTRIYKHQKPW